MIFVAKEIVKVLSENLTFPGVSVQEFYKVISLKPPLVTVNELPGKGVYFPDGQPRFVQNTYQIEAYCKQYLGQAGNVTKLEAAQELLKELDIIIQEKFGLTQVGDVDLKPYINDPTIMRGVVRYRGIIDTKTEFIYR